MFRPQKSGRNNGLVVLTGWSYGRVPLYLINLFNFVVIVEDGKRLEKELNDTGPGEGYFIKCDVSKEEDIKVIKLL